MRVIGALLGIPEQDQVAVRDAADAGLHIEEGQDGVEARSTSELVGLFAETVAYRREHPGDDLISALLRAEFVDEHGAERHLREDELLNYVALVAAAGNETVARLLGWAGHTLARHPDQRQILLDEPGAIPNAVEELLRYEAPSPVQARVVTRDVEWYGTTVPEGSVMLLLTGAAGRDERQYADPDRFDVRRPIDHHLSFGYGLHYCLGAALARLEGRVAIEELLARFPTWELDEDGAEMVHTSTVRGWHRLPVTLPVAPT
jgi:cytochrome P450